MLDVNELSRFFVDGPPAYCKMAMRCTRIAVQSANPVQGSYFQFARHLVHGFSDSFAKGLLPFLNAFSRTLERTLLRRDDNVNDIFLLQLSTSWVQDAVGFAVGKIIFALRE